MTLRLIQFEDTNGGRAVGIVDGSEIRVLDVVASVNDLAMEAISAGLTLAEHVANTPVSGLIDYDDLISDGRVLPPVDHPDPAGRQIEEPHLTRSSGPCLVTPRRTLGRRRPVTGLHLLGSDSRRRAAPRSWSRRRALRHTRS